MDKADKNQTELHFDQRKSQSSAGDHVVINVPGGADMPPGEELKLRQILATMQRSLTPIGSKIDSFSFRMDRMTERLDKHTERLNQSERRISDVEWGQSTAVRLR
ncbi:hypothetical protein NDU88_010331 [Pleurodeles waltl]|uniref:Uncharacterized protein n=1 Tax=Pleurodeles waltl TaxID=8319 RepID=A0AAV7RXX6_PLEWA|nr:hypothetical protein NDU88_010331 [Pleurodeles waltl]